VIKVGKIILQKNILDKIENLLKKNEESKQLERLLAGVM